MPSRAGNRYWWKARSRCSLVDEDHRGAGAGAHASKGFGFLLL